MSIMMSFSNVSGGTQQGSRDDGVVSFSSEEELSRGEFGYSSGVESGLVQTDSTVARQLHPAVTDEEVTNLGEDALFDTLFVLIILLLLLRRFLDDFLGGSDQWMSEILVFVPTLS